MPGSSFASSFPWPFLGSVFSGFERSFAIDPALSVLEALHSFRRGVIMGGRNVWLSVVWGEGTVPWRIQPLANNSSSMMMMGFCCR